MSGHDELRQRIGRLDPVLHHVSVPPVDGPEAREHLEQIMEQDVTTTTTTDHRQTRSRQTLWLAAAAVLAVLAVGVAVVDGSGGGDGEAVQLTAGSAEGTLSSCIALEPAILAQSPMAFRGTATSVDGDVVTLDVAEWYVGGDADTVEVTATQGMTALIGELDFTVGDEYLISAHDGVVNLCGFSGPATPELQGVYDEAFSG